MSKNAKNILGREHKMQHSFSAFVFSFITILFLVTIGFLCMFKTYENIQKNESWFKFGLSSAVFFSFALFFSICLIIS